MKEHLLGRGGCERTFFVSALGRDASEKLFAEAQRESSKASAPWLFMWEIRSSKVVLFSGFQKAIGRAARPRPCGGREGGEGAKAFFGVGRL